MMNQSNFIKLLVGISVLASLFHLLILIKVIPYDITWGGRLKTDQEMYVFETFSLVVNFFFIYVLLQKGHFVKAVFSPKALTLILWVFFALFTLNTIGNLFAKTTFERGFTVLTLLNALLLWQINKKA